MNAFLVKSSSKNSNYQRIVLESTAFHHNVIRKFLSIVYEFNWPELQKQEILLLNKENDIFYYKVFNITFSVQQLEVIA